MFCCVPPSAFTGIVRVPGNADANPGADRHKHSQVSQLTLHILCDFSHTRTGRALPFPAGRRIRSHTRN